MGLFSNLFKSVPNQPSLKFANEKEAFFAILYACISADGDVDDDEIDGFIRSVNANPFLGDLELVDTYRDLAIKKQKFGIGVFINSALPLISEKRKKSLFITAVDLVLADGVVDKKEEELLEDIQNGLSIDAEFAQKVIEVMLAKNNI